MTKIMWFFLSKNYLFCGQSKLSKKMYSTYRKISRINCKYLKQISWKKRRQKYLFKLKTWQLQHVDISINMVLIYLIFGFSAWKNVCVREFLYTQLIWAYAFMNDFVDVHNLMMRHTSYTHTQTETKTITVVPYICL